MILYCVLIAVVALFSRFFALLIAVPFVTKLVFATDEQEVKSTSKSPALLQHQRKLAREIKRARQMALIPYVG